jgi:processive rubber oxygenase RoxA-like protein
MIREQPVTAVEEALHRRWRLLTPIYILLAIIALIGIVATVLGVIALWEVAQNRTPHYADIVDEFKYGSIGAEPNSGIPYRIWQALPTLFPEAFAGRKDYSAFGFIYENDGNGRPRDLPIGISKRTYRDVDIVWFNCGTCHTGTVHATMTDPDGQERTGLHIIPGMPSDNLNFYGFIRFLLDAGADERLSPDKLIPAMNATGPKLGIIEKAVYRWYVIPLLREGLVQRRTRLLPLLTQQPPWGPGRVDTFNPYKLIQANMPLSTLQSSELIGTADFPSIFHQGPREGMHLHWDGNNTSLAERNLSAAMGAGVTPDTVDHDTIDRVANWLLELRPPPSPYHPDAAAVGRGRDIYMVRCRGCHGAQDAHDYDFTGQSIGQVEPNSRLGVDPHRLDSYTEQFREYQLANFFKGTPYQFKYFVKTDGYANLPLDGLWLRAPYLHNGSVPTLAALLATPDLRPAAFVRGGDKLDAINGGFEAPSCDPKSPPAGAFCYDTHQPGNGNSGHLYGTDLDPPAKADLLAYLLTF